MSMPTNRYFEPKLRKITGADKKDLRELVYEAVAERRPPGTFKLMLDGQRPVVNVRCLITMCTKQHDIYSLFDLIGDRIDQWTYVLYPPDVVTKLLREELDFDFHDEPQRCDRWRVE